ncbi:hypothetical protein GOA63_16420 [Sinorhizobium meliloti]|uniref:hypothetical protein n=1 Tax=Rhizobium meliloti TaxID=382 RepID=UPI001294AF31|nr:hypothetical protein [Sinorhizobium meliloti]MDW9593791.1 hypothetical protein [Sinorhizobium meliloti]MDX0188863.1 hypothetical protein [Sinorhizobium meliloti]MQV10083.1 hypothetical protein [Sinorhizobium meliloti]MQV59235.1 hypothetical protein [Sinorhizobium meliloti]
MKPSPLIDALRKRTSIRVARRVLAEYRFPRGSGWDQIVEKLKDKDAAAKADYPGLERGLSEILIASDKSLRVYQLSAGDVATLRATVASLAIPPSGVFTTHHPYPVPDNILSGLPPQPAVPVSKFSGQQATGILFSSISIIEQRERLTAAQIGPTASAYDEVIGIKKIKSQTFDALIVSKSKNYAYVLTDAHIDTTQGTRNALHSNMKAAINTIAKTTVLETSINLLPFIEPIYNSPDGAVKRLHYTTTTSSGKEEWMRGGGNCLRQELAHKAGMTVLAGGFKSYGIEIEYPLDKVHGYIPRPSLAINGTYRMTYETNPRVEDATIEGCATQVELEETIAELMHHISGSKSI